MSTKAEALLKPWCPFCGMDVGRPLDAAQRKMREFPLGRCECGAVYVCDATGHNVGAAMVECLVSACGDNWDLAWELVPEEDYLTGRLEDYDDVTHQVVPKRNLDGRAVRGILYFVRLHAEMHDLTRRFQEKQATAAGGAQASGKKAGDVAEAAETRPQEPVRDPKGRKRRASKEDVLHLAGGGDVEALVTLYYEDHRVLRFFQRLLYEPEAARRYHAAWILGQVCGRIAGREPGAVADLLHRLFEACSDSASSSWGMIEAIGAIIAARPDIYGAFTRHLFAYMGDPGTREAVLWGLGEIAATRPDLVRKTPFYALFPILTHQEPVMRGLTLRLLGRIGAREAALQIMGLQKDESPVLVYEQGKAVATTVAALSAEASRMIHEEDKHGA